MVVLHVAALERIEEMGDGRIFGRDRNLHPPLSHHAIGVAKPKLRGQDYLGTGRHAHAGPPRIRLPRRR